MQSFPDCWKVIEEYNVQQLFLQIKESCKYKIVDLFNNTRAMEELDKKIEYNRLHPHLEQEEPLTYQDIAMQMCLQGESVKPLLEDIDEKIKMLQEEVKELEDRIKKLREDKKFILATKKRGELQKNDPRFEKKATSLHTRT